MNDCFYNHFEERLDMSSFIGHSFAALGTSFVEQPTSLKNRKYWLLWLIIIGSFPDIDHAIKSLHLTANYQLIRITHSIFLSLLLPVCTIILLIFWGFKGRALWVSSQQLILAGLSHLVLDLLTGVNSLPLLWPLSTENFKLGFGLLPSAGVINIFNYFLYRNLLIELGVIVPLVYLAYLISNRLYITSLQKTKIGGLLTVSICFMFWAFSLER